MRKEWSIIVDILEVDLDISVAHQTIASLVLGEHCEPPLRSTIGLVSVQGLKQDNDDELSMMHYHETADYHGCSRLSQYIMVLLQLNTEPDK